MRILLLALLAVALPLAAQDKKPPAKLTFKAKNGDVLFDHAKHVTAAKNDCKACHDKLWPQSAKAPLNYKAALHKTAEAKETSCAACHHPKGTSFATKGNCNKCHQKKT